MGKIWKVQNQTHLSLSQDIDAAHLDAFNKNTRPVKEVLLKYVYVNFIDTTLLFFTRKLQRN